ncbi:MAG: hypothetical protein GXY83_08850 [Rhodopirellula sp.]|nr:hypothetical protein [Rhodopirellula sp.]
MSGWWEVNLFTASVWLAICVAVLAVILWLVCVAPRRESREDAEALLRRRYVDGEIDDNEFERCLEELQRKQ